MASNKHYGVDVSFLEAVEIEAPDFDELLRIADLPNSPNPFGNRLKRGKFVKGAGKNWLFDENISNFNYQRSGYANEISQFRLDFSFDAPLTLNEIDSNRFLYSFSRRIAQSSWRDRQRGAGAYFQFGHLDKGSIRGEIFAGIVAIGTFVASYPDLKNGFQEIITDTQFVAEKITTALRAAKLPEPVDDSGQQHSSDILAREQPRRKRPPNRMRAQR